MSESVDPGPQIWALAAIAAAVFAVDPVGCGGVAVRGLPGPVRDRWMETLRALSPALKLRRVPLHVGEGRLLGGLDLAATLQAGRPIAERGLLAEADGGVVVLAMAERVGAVTAAHLAAAMDWAEVVTARDGVALRSAASLGVVAFDEGIADDEGLSPVLADRLAFHVDFSSLSHHDITPDLHSAEDVAAAQSMLASVQADDAIITALCATAQALGVASLRAPLLALRVARAVAALDGRSEVIEADATLAARLVLAPRATLLPAPPPPPSDADQPETPDDADTPPDEPQPDQNPQPDTALKDGALDDVVLDAARAAIPADLLARLLAGAPPARGQSAGKSGAFQKAGARGRPAGIRRGLPRAGARLNVVETLRAAAPWQRLRQRAMGIEQRARIEIRADDFHITRTKQRAETVTIFAVDASGSAALNRLAEAKGAVELLLADCYIRRDQVALIAFRGTQAETLLPPTRSLVRAKRSLGGLPGGGGTPLASAIDTAVAMALAIRRRGQTPSIVFLTDGRANIARSGAAGRPAAEADALAAARLLRAAGVAALLVDTSPRPHQAGRDLAAAMHATYLPLPYANAMLLSGAVRAATAP